MYSFSIDVGDPRFLVTPNNRIRIQLVCEIHFTQMGLIRLGLFLLGVIISHLFFDMIKEKGKCNNNQLLTQFGQNVRFDSMQNPQRYVH